MNVESEVREPGSGSAFQKSWIIIHQCKLSIETDFHFGKQNESPSTRQMKSLVLISILFSSYCLCRQRFASRILDSRAADHGSFS